VNQRGDVVAAFHQKHAIGKISQLLSKFSSHHLSVSLKRSDKRRVASKQINNRRSPKCSVGG
jgi:hypothetical protein